MPRPRTLRLTLPGQAKSHFVYPRSRLDMLLTGRNSENPIRWSLILFTLALVPRLIAALMFGNAYLFPDEIVYSDAARVLLFGGDPQQSAIIWHNAPGYPFFLSLFSAPLLDNLVLVRMVQATIVSFGAVLTYQLGRQIFGHWAAVAASVIYAFDPLLVTTSALIYPETLAGLLLLGTLILVLHTQKSGELLSCAAIGLLLGLCALLRPIAVVIAPVLLLWLVFTASTMRSRLFRLAGVSLVFVLTVIPLVSHNYKPQNLVDPSRNSHPQADESLSDSRFKPESLLYDILLKAWEEPLIFGRELWYHFLHFWELYPTRLWVDREENRGEFGYFNTQFTPSARNFLSALSFSFELVLALVGLALAFKYYGRETVLILAVILTFALGYSFFMGKIRYRIPILPEVFIFSGVGVTAVCTAVGRLRKSR